MSLQTAFLHTLQVTHPFNPKWLNRILPGIALTLGAISIAPAATDCTVTEISQVECESSHPCYVR